MYRIKTNKPIPSPTPNPLQAPDLHAHNNTDNQRMLFEGGADGPGQRAHQHPGNRHWIKDQQNRLLVIGCSLPKGIIHTCRSPLDYSQRQIERSSHLLSHPKIDC